MSINGTSSLRGVGRPYAALGNREGDRLGLGDMRASAAQEPRGPGRRMRGGLPTDPGPRRSKNSMCGRPPLAGDLHRINYATRQPGKSSTPAHPQSSHTALRL